MDNEEIRFALVQYKAVKGNLAKNLARHKAYCAEAARQNADIVVFPELSLSGYELALLEALALEVTSQVIEELSATSVENNVIVISGCPLKSDEPKPYISAVICFPDGKVDFYSKQYLHDGESDYCVAGNQNYFLDYKGLRIALAVCADFTERRHQIDSKANNSDVYLVSALISKGGFPKDGEILSGIASEYKVPVLLSNFIGETGGWDTGGKNTVWNNKGQVVAQGNDSDEGITFCSIAREIITEAKFLDVIP